MGQKIRHEEEADIKHKQKLLPKRKQNKKNLALMYVDGVK